MKSSLWLKSLFRSPVRTIVTWVLLLAAAFLFTQSLADYSATRLGLDEAKARMKGTLSLEHAPGLDPSSPGNSSHFNLFLITDPTAPGTGMPIFPAENFHPQNITAGELENLTTLPGVAGAEIRTMTAGVSDYLRPDAEFYEYCYEARLVLEATVSAVEQESFFQSDIVRLAIKGIDQELSCLLRLEDVRVLGGDEGTLPVEANGSCCLLVPVFPEETRGQASLWTYNTNSSYGRDAAVMFWNKLCSTEAEALKPGRRYLFAVRVETWLSDYAAGYPQMVFADDTLMDWWPYITDITDLPENYLEGENFAPLRELIQVTNDDWHTLDVVYAGDMSVIRRSCDLRLIPAEGRFLEPEDAGKPVCVVNADFAYANGLGLGDTLRLKLGDYPMEQHEVLGAVASTRGRYAENWTEQEFTIVGTWRDINQGDYLKEDQIWSYSDATVFVPSSFLPEGAKKADRSPGEVTLLIDADAMNAFVKNELPRLEAEGWITYWNDRGWPQMEEELRLVVQAAWYKLLAFGVATLLVIALTVYLFISRRSRDYAILRALGMNRSGSGKSLLIPLLCLTLAAVIPGAAVALLWYGRGGEQVNPLALVGVPVLIFLPLLAALVMVTRMGNTSPLALLQSKRRQK